MLACIYYNNNETKINEKFDCIRLLVDSGAKLNVRNKESGFTCMHWVARYGEIENVRFLCERGMAIYVPDMHGYIPLDYAGLFDCKEVMIYLIKQGIQQCKKELEKFFKLDEEKGQSIKRKNNLRQHKHADHMCLFSGPELQINPIYRSKLLYWAACLDENEFSWKEMRQMLIDIEPWSEYKNSIDNNKTALHIACIKGYPMKTRLILNDLRKRYQFDMDKSNINLNMIKQNAFNRKYPTNVELKNSLLKKLSFHSIKEAKDDFFTLQKKIKKFETRSIKQRFHIDFCDKDGLTPLHYACQFNNPICARILILENYANIEKSCESGFRPRNLLQNERIKNLFIEFYDNIDKDIARQQLKEISKKIIKKITKKSIINWKNNVQKLHKKEFEMDKKDTKLKDKWQNEEVMRFDSFDLSDVDEYKELDEIELQNQNHACWLNFRKNLEKKKKNNDETDMIIKILENRECLPEISSFSIKVCLKDLQDKNRVNDLIKTLLYSRFIVRMFQSIDDPAEKVYFLTVELSQKDLETEAEKQEHKVKLLGKDLKFKYIESQKQDYEPLRSKDISEIYYSIIKKVTKIEELTKEGKTIKDYQYIHDLNEQSDILEKFENLKVWMILKQNFYDRSYQEYHALTSIKNYLGERWGFQYAFMNFYTCWLIFPAIGGMVCQCYIIYTGNWFSLISFLYSIIVSIWMTFLQEFWKRKQNELRLMWGTYEHGINEDLEIRDEFEGNEEFSHNNFEVNRNDTKRFGKLFSILNIFIVILFSGTGVVSFISTKTLLKGEFMKKASGVINSIIIAATNKLYQMSITPLVKKQNIKHKQDYNKELALKIFTFQFINANFSVVYQIYYESDMKDLQYLLIGMVISNAGSIAAAKYSQIIKFRLKKWWYFKQVQNRAQEQKKLIDQSIKNILDENQEIKAELESHEKDRKEMELFKHLNDKKDNLEFKRLVSIFTPDDKYKGNIENGCIDTEPLFIDQIELNFRFNPIIIEKEIRDLSKIYIMLSYLTLYSFICPPISIILLINNVVTMDLDRTVHLFYIQRQPLIIQNGLGPWMAVIEILNKATIFFNCLFLFWFRDKFASDINQIFTFLRPFYPKSIEAQQMKEISENMLHIMMTGQDENNPFAQMTNNRLNQDEGKLKDHDIMKFFIIIMFIEHFIALFKIYIEEIIEDAPKFVQKKAIKVLHEKEKMGQQQKQIENDQKVQELEDKIKSQEKQFAVYVKQTNDYRKKVNVEHMNLQRQYAQTIQQKDEFKFQNDRFKNLQLQKLTETNYAKKHAQSKLVHFLENRFGKKYDGAVANKFEFALNQQLQIRLFRETFYDLERKILQNRLNQISNTDRLLCINCCICESKMADVQCHDCEKDFFCQQCYNDEHPKENSFFDKHKTLDINEFTERNKSSNQKQTKYQNLTRTAQMKDGQFQKLMISMSRWQKIQKFNFPLPESNDLFDQLRCYFVFIKETFISMNNINLQEQNLDFVKHILDKNFKILGEKEKKSMLKQFQRENKESQNQGNSVEQISGNLEFKLDHLNKNYNQIDVKLKEYFNDEELLFLNRVSFYVLSVYQAALSFPEFIGCMTLIQDGTFSEKINLVCEFLKQGRKDYKIVKIDNVINFFSSSMPQDTHHQLQAEGELRNLLALGDDQKIYLDIDEVKEKLLGSKGNSREILKCVLQIL